MRKKCSYFVQLTSSTRVYSGYIINYFTVNKRKIRKSSLLTSCVAFFLLVEQMGFKLVAKRYGPDQTAP